VVACSLNPNVNFDTNNPLLVCASYYNSPNVDNLQPLHEGGGVRNPYSVTIDE